MIRILSIVLTVDSNPLLSTLLINNLPDVRKGKVGVNFKMLINILDLSQGAFSHKNGLDHLINWIHHH